MGVVPSMVGVGVTPHMKRVDPSMVGVIGVPGVSGVQGTLRGARNTRRARMPRVLGC